MNRRDLHSAPKSDIVTRAHRGALQAMLARLQWSKNEVAYSLHVNPSSWTTAGIQRTDFLAYLGFQRSETCPFTGIGCFVKSVTEEFDADAFLTAFETGFTHLERAER